MSSDVNKNSVKVGINRFWTACLFWLKIWNAELLIHWVEIIWKRRIHFKDISLKRMNKPMNGRSVAQCASEASSAEWANASAISYYLYPKLGKTISLISESFQQNLIFVPLKAWPSETGFWLECIRHASLHHTHMPTRGWPLCRRASNFAYAWGSWGLWAD